MLAGGKCGWTEMCKSQRVFFCTQSRLSLVSKSFRWGGMCLIEQERGLLLAEVKVFLLFSIPRSVHLLTRFYRWGFLALEFEILYIHKYVHRACSFRGVGVRVGVGRSEPRKHSTQHALITFCSSHMQTQRGFVCTAGVTFKNSLLACWGLT